MTDYSWRKLSRGQKHRTELPVDVDLTLPLLVVRGISDGPTLVVSANVHGDEYEGVRAIFETFEESRPEAMKGDLVLAPVVNPPAFWNVSRRSPADDINLARVFPGKPDGSVSERIAYQFAHQVIAGADFYLDLHSGGVQCRMPSMVGFYSRDDRSAAAAEIFGASVIWSHNEVAPGRSISFASARRIPWLYTEARGAGRIHPDDLAMMKRGIRNLLSHLGMVSSPIETVPVGMRLNGDGDLDTAITATQRGFLLRMVQVLDRVTSGQLLGVLVDIHGQQLEVYRAPRDGVIGMVRELPVIQPFDSLFLLANEQ